MLITGNDGRVIKNSNYGSLENIWSAADNLITVIRENMNGESFTNLAIIDIVGIITNMGNNNGDRTN